MIHSATAHAAPLAHQKPKSVTILGSTGTIGVNTIKLLEESSELFRVEALTAKSRVTELAEQAKRLHAKTAVIQDVSLYKELKALLSGTGITAAAGNEAICSAAAIPCDLIVSGIVGAAALKPTLSGIKNGTTIALANKECLVCAGDLVMQESALHGAMLLPVDSEHNAVFQSLDYDRAEKIEKITLTASGGPFLHTPQAHMRDITPAMAVKHPNWNMGAKISVDSATMMNKGLEIIEAYHLFPVKKEQLDVLVHPESIVHCLVSYVDGSSVAGISVPDMCVPIAHALAWPDRMHTSTARLDLAAVGTLSFYTPDRQKFPALSLAQYALQEGGTAPAVLNAANEVAVESFLEGKIGFLDIVKTVETVLDSIPAKEICCLDDVLETDNEARRKAYETTGSLSGR